MKPSDPTHEAVAATLKRDVLGESLRVLEPLGVSKDDAYAAAMPELFRHNAEKEALLRLSGDTHLGMTPDDLRRILTEHGFGLVLHEDFSHKHYGTLFEGCAFEVWWRDDGLLLHFDTFYPDRVNGGTVHFNLRIPKEKAREVFGHSLSGHFIDFDTDAPVWVGHRDVREGLVHFLRSMEAVGGAFVSPWGERPFLWLCQWADNKDEDGEQVPDALPMVGPSVYELRSHEREARLPEYVRAAITVSKPPAPPPEGR